ncbi:MAG: V-type ATP synthase subunit A, partial [Ruthenibacterium sp.]
PAINWTISYSEYYEDLDPYYLKNVGPDFCKLRGRMLSLLSEENKLMEIVKLIGSDVLPDSQRVTLETARVIRVGFLQQNAFHENDTYVPLIKQQWMMDAILHLYDKAVELVDEGVPVSAMAEAGLFDKLIKVKYEIPNDKPEMFGAYETEMDDICAKLLAAHNAPVLAAQTQERK